jgi:hypothetical protein
MAADEIEKVLWGVWWIKKQWLNLHPGL